MRSKIFKVILAVTLIGGNFCALYAKEPSPRPKPPQRIYQITGQSSQLNAQVKEPLQYVPGEVIVQLKEGANLKEIMTILNVSAKNVKRLCPISEAVDNFKKTYTLEKTSEGWYSFLGKNYKEVAQIPDEEFFKAAYSHMPDGEKAMYRGYRIILPQNLSVKEAIAKLKKNSSVENAEPNIILKVMYVPSDPLYNQQWSYQETQTEAGWNSSRGNANVVIAVIDSGIMRPLFNNSDTTLYTHEDLHPNVQKIDSTYYGRDVVDINLSDYTAYGYSFMENGQYLDDYQNVDNYPRDRFGHGMHVAGVIAAVANNAKGGAGLAHQCKVLGVRAGFTVKDPEGYYTVMFELDDIVRGINWAMNQPNVKVINMSFASPYYSAILENAVNAAYDKGILIVAAAGNTDNTAPNYPAAFTNVIAVAATGKKYTAVIDGVQRETRDIRADYSSYGSWVDVCAPGGNNDNNDNQLIPSEGILGTVAKNSVLALLYGPSCGYVAGGNNGVDGGYMLLQGTSMASPFVAGLAGLIFAKEPNLTHEQVRNRIVSTADNIYYLSPNAAYAGKLGSGRVNCYRAITNTAAQPIISASAYESQVAMRPNETINIALSLKNTGDTAMDTTVTLSSTDPLVTITTATVNFGNLANGETKNNSGNPFKIKVNNNFPLSHKIEFSATINANNYTSSQKIEISGYRFKTGWPKEILSTAEYAGYSKVVVDDINKDGKQEIISLYSQEIADIENNLATKIKFYVRDPSGNLLSANWQEVSLENYHEPQGIAVGDITGDNKKELAYGTYEGLYVFNSSGAVLSNGLLENTKHFDVNVPVLADLDADGKLDIVACSYDENYNTTLWAFNLNSTSPTLNWNKTINSYFMSSIATGDLDLSFDAKGKQHPEIVIGLNKSANPQGLHIAAYDYTGQKRWQYERPNYSLRQIEQKISLGDVNNDGFAEVIYTAKAADNQTFLVGILDKDGRFLKDITFTPPAGANFINGSNVSLADIDQDQILEMVGIVYSLTNGAVNGYSIFACKADGSSKTLASLSNVAYLFPDLIVADVNGDKQLEILAHSYNKLYAWSNSGTLLNNYCVDFSPQMYFFDIPPTVADADKDGKVEILGAHYQLVNNTYHDMLHVFSPGSTYNAGYMPWPIQNANLENTRYGLKSNAPAPANTAPTLDSLAPNSGNLRAGVLLDTPNSDHPVLSASYSDANGAADLEQCRILMDPKTSPDGKNCFHAVYYPATNTICLANDAGSDVTMGVLGSDTILRNKSVIIKCSDITKSVSSDGETLTLNWKVTLLQNLAGTQNVYLYAADKASHKTGWVKKGTFNVINNKPTCESLSPVSGIFHAGSAVEFVAKYKDEDGVQNLKEAHFILSKNAPNTSAANRLYALYDYSLNKLYLRKWDNSGWITAPGAAPGAEVVLSDGHAKLNCKNISKAIEGDNKVLVVKWNASLCHDFITGPNTQLGYLLAVDNAQGSSAWQQKGIFTITDNAPVTGSAGSTTNPASANTPLVISSLYSDADGAGDLMLMQLLVNNTASLAKCLNVWYDRSTSNIYLSNDAGTDVVKDAGGNIINASPGSDKIIENSYAKIYCKDTVYRASQPNANSSYMDWRVEFKPAFTGGKNIYLRAIDYAGLESGYNQKGTLDIMGVNLPPQVGTVSPASGTSNINDNYTTFTATYLDGNGWQNLNNCAISFNTAANNTDCLYAVYYQDLDKVYMPNALGQVIGVKPGQATSGTIENAYGILNCAATTVSGSGNTLTINWSFKFKQAAVGNKNIYLKANEDITDASTAYIQKGTRIITGLGPASPSNLSASNTAQTQTVLSWNDNSNDESGFKIQMSQNDGAWADLPTTIGSNSTSYTVNNLQSATRYKFRVRAYNATGESGHSNEAQIITVPGDLQNLRAVAQDATHIRLEWLNPDLSPDTLIDVERKRPAEAQYFLLLTLSNQPTTWVDGPSGLETAGTYSYRLRAKNASGASGYATTDIAFPTPNTGPQVGTITPEEGRSFVDQAVTFITTYSDPGGWQDIHHAELAIGLANGKYVYAYYEQNSNKLYLRDNSSAGNLIGGYLPGTNNTIDHPYAVLNCAGSKAEGQSNTLTISWNLAFKAAFFDLTANTETKNTFLLVYDDANAHQGWLKKGTWTIEKAQSDATPYGLTATVRSSTQIDLAWQHNYVNGTSYVLERDSSPNFNTADFRSSNIGINKQHSDSGLSPNTTYYYRVLASYQGELSDPSNVANATTYPNAPQAPTNLTASEITPLGAKLSWTNPANNNQTGFKISIYENGAWKDHSEAQQTTTIINALNTASDYKFRVRAYNAGGDSANSNEAEVLTIPAARTGFSAQVENIKAKLTWLNPDQHPSTSIEIWRQITALDQDYLKLTQVSSQTTNWLDEGEELTCGGTVKYKLIATNPSGSSDAALAEVTFSFNNSAPYVGDLLPNSGALTSNQFMVLKAYYYDPDGYNNLRKCYLVANKQISDSGGLSAYYDRGTQKTIYLYSDNGQTTQNGLLGTNTILSNSYVEIDCAKTKVYFFGNRIRVEWYVKFKPAFFTNNPSPKGWLKAKDKGGLACDWQQKASW